MKHGFNKESKSASKGMAFVEIALWLPILIPVVLGVGYIYHYIRTYQIVSIAAHTAAEIASSASAIDPNTGNAIFAEMTDAPNRPRYVRDWDECKNLSGAAIAPCIAAQNTKGMYNAMVWNGWGAGDTPGLAANKAYNLPFKLYEEFKESGNTTIPGYNLVQTLPLVGIPRACFEPLNETAAHIQENDRRRLFGTEGWPDVCSQVKPMYWKSPHRADFDGDGREDLVFFRPQGVSTNWGQQQTLSEADFLVLYSSGAYSAAAGYGYFNLSTRDPADGATVPYDIPVVADYDRDGLSDYAIFSPKDGQYRIALSRARYRTIYQKILTGTGDALGTKGLVAIPGNYQYQHLTQIAVFATGGSPAERFKIILSSPFTNHQDGETLDADFAKSAAGLSDIYPDTSDDPGITSDSAAMKPHRGLVSVPAFADYDDDGVTEIGYLSWHGGNWSKHVLGQVPAPTADVFNSDPFDSSDEIPAAAGVPPYWRINPFDTAFDASGNFFVVDSVDSRIWKTSAPDANGTFNGGTADAIMPLHTTVQSRSGRDLGFNENQDFPAQNVLNVPFEDISTLGNDAEGPQTAGTMILRNPKKIVVANAAGYDGAMYIADWGNGRIIRINAAASGGNITSSTPAKVILGSNTCITNPSSCTELDISGHVCWNSPSCMAGATSPVLWDPCGGGPIESFTASDADDGGIYGGTTSHLLNEVEEGGGGIVVPTPTCPPPPPTATPVPSISGKYKIYPMALEIVPDQTDPDRYFLAFSSHNNIFLITHTNASGGPRGSGSATDEKIWRVAGMQNRTGAWLNHDYSVSLGAGNLALTDQVEMPPPYNTPGVLQFDQLKARDSRICPVTDIKFKDWGGPGRRLYAASSCSVSAIPAAAPNPSFAQLAESNFSGVFELEPTEVIIAGEPDFGGLGGGPTEHAIIPIIGSFRRSPCNDGGAQTLCAGPNVDGEPGIYQRKINLSVAPAPAGTPAALYTDVVNIVDMEFVARPNSTDSLLFVHQWNDSSAMNIPLQPEGNDREYYNHNPKHSDSQHIHEIYGYTFDAQRLYPLTNPYSYGGGTVPVESAHWYSPYTGRGSAASLGYRRYIDAHEAPIKNIPFPVGSSIALSLDKKFLFAATPFLANPASYLASSHPYVTDVWNVGFIFRTKLDQDGDEIADYLDNNDDGDAYVNAADNDDYCPEIFDGGSTECRVQEKIGNPIMYFTKFDTGSPWPALYLGGADGSGPTGRNYGEYFFFNSVSECGPSDVCAIGQYAGADARQEPWATLLNFGDNQMLLNDPVCDLMADGTDGNPYFACQRGGNGPIAVPMALHALVGDVGDSYAGKQYTRDTAGSPQLLELTGGNANLFLYPGILSSTYPKENGIKVTRRKSTVGSGKSPRTSRAGVLCKDYEEDVLDPDGNPAVPAMMPLISPRFGLDLDSGTAYLRNYLHTGLEASNDSTIDVNDPDNDNLGYIAECRDPLDPPPAYPDGRVPATEGIVLQLDHDDTSDKMAGSAVHWPSGTILPPNAPENYRQFTLIDSDGDGVDNPSWWTTDAFMPWGDGSMDPSTRGLYMFISGNMKENPGHQYYLNKAREPFNSSVGLTALGVSLPATSVFPLNTAFNYYDVDGILFEQNLGFDNMRQNDTPSPDDRGYGIFVSVGFEPFLTPQFAAYSTKDTGAAMYADYTLNNRFQFSGAANELPLGESPAIIAAKNVLKLALGDNIVFHTSKATFDLATNERHAFISLLRKDEAGQGTEEPCNPLSAPSAEDSCAEVAVYYKMHYLRNTITVKKRASLNLSGLSFHAPICDPEDPEGMGETRTLGGLTFNCVSSDEVVVGEGGGGEPIPEGGGGL